MGLGGAVVRDDRGGLVAVAVNKIRAVERGGYCGHGRRVWA